MKAFVLLLSICVKMSLCWHLARQDKEFNYDVNITQNPWMVMIVKKGHDIVSYGALFHQRAVLTTAAINQNEIFGMQVFADCHMLGSKQDIDHKICQNVRNITEYNVVQKSPEAYNYFNLAVLILSSPFKLSPTLNVLHFGHESGVQLNNCVVSYPTLVTNPKTNETGMLFYPSLNISWTAVSVEVVSSFKDVKPQEIVRILPGSPLLCQSKTKTDEWYAIAILTEIVRANQPPIGARTTGMSFESEKMHVLPEIVKHCKIPGDLSEVIFYYH